MSDTLIVLHTAIAIIAIVLLIVVVKVDPVISLVIGTLYLGVAAGLGFGDTIGTFVQGFGDIMAEVGLLIGFGVLMGTLLTAMGALQKLVELLLRILGPRRLPYAFSAALTTIFPAIYVIILGPAVPHDLEYRKRSPQDGIGRLVCLDHNELTGLGPFPNCRRRERLRQRPSRAGRTAARRSCSAPPALSRQCAPSFAQRR